MRHPFLTLSPLVVLLALCGCGEPTPQPDGEPQATAVAADESTELREAISAPLDKAKAVDATQAAEEAERQQVLEASGG